MFSLSEKFHEQFSRIQQEFNEWSSFEQFYAAVILTGTLQSLSYRHFLAQLLANNVKRENDKMFNHTVDQANTPAILACLLSEPLDKLFSTLQLYLPLLATMTNNEKLLDTYRDVLIYLDSKLPTTTTITTTTTSSLSNEQTQMFSACQQLLFFIRTHPLLQRYAGNIPQLTALAMMASPSSSTNPLHTEEDSHPVIDYSSSPPLRQGLARNSSIRHYQHVSPQQLINFSSDGVISSLNDPVSQRLIRHETNDSGVDLSETANNPSSIGQDKLLHHHPFVAKTASSPTPEQTLSSRPPPVPLAAVLSAPVQSLGSYYSDLRHHHTQQMNSTTTQVMISDEDDNESHLQQHSFLDHTQSLNTDTQLTSRTHEFFFSEMNRNEIETNKQRLGQFYSLRNRNSRYNNGEINSANQGVSQYLGVDSNSTTLRNTFTQANTGMRDVPKWLKNLRLHKYAFFFSQMTYDEMMNLTMEQLKKENITDGACTKILLNIKKLKDRQATLQQCLIDMDNGTSDIKMIIQQLNDLMLTPIRSNRIETIPMEGDDDEDLPNMIMQVLAKVISSSSNLSTEMGNAMVGLFDRCYKHEAFSSKQRDQLLQWRGKLCHILQKLGKFEFKSMQASSLLVHNPLRRTQQQLKPQISMGNIVSSQNVKPPVRIIKSNLGISSSSYYPNTNYQSSPSQQQQQNSIPLARQFNSESPHNGPMNNSSNQNGPSDSNVIRRPSPAISKSPTLIFIANENSNEEPMMISPPQHQIPLVPTHSLQEHSSSSSYYQTNPPYITERAGNGSGNLRPSFNYATSTPLRNGGSYLAANQHPILTRKTSIDPYGGENTTSTPNNINENKSKLCKTFSDPSKIRFYNPAHIISMQSASTRPIERPQPSSSSQTMFNMMGSPYPQQQQQQQFLTQSQPVAFDSSSFGNKTESSSSNNAGMENVYDQRNNHPELESLCRSITDSALCDDVSESSTDHNEEISNSNPPPTSSSLTDAEQ